jgi:hypothetical protein
MAAPTTPGSSKYFPSIDDEVPIIDSSEDFSDVVRKLSIFIARAVDAAYTYEQLRTSVAGQNLRPLISSLSEDCNHRAIVAALLASRYLFTSTEIDDSGLSDSRGLACELVGWQFLTFLSEKELIDYLLFELPHSSSAVVAEYDSEAPTRSNGSLHGPQQADESTSLLHDDDVNQNNFNPPKRDVPFSSSETRMDEPESSSLNFEDPAKSLAGMNALEIAAVCDAKKFLSQKPVQKIVADIWNGDVIFWESLSAHSVKKARPYNKRVADPFARLRVPKYQKAFQVLFFVSLLVLYYAVLVERSKSIVPSKTCVNLEIASASVLARLHASISEGRFYGGKRSTYRPSHDVDSYFGRHGLIMCYRSKTCDCDRSVSVYVDCSVCL